MPARNDIAAEIHRKQNSAGMAHDAVRRKFLKKLCEQTGHDTILYAVAFTSGHLSQIPPHALSVSTQDIQGFMSALHGLSGNKLDLILHSPGGELEAAEQIVHYLRAKYDYIRAIIPQNAMSAATMIACACDEIVMGKHSAIGPTDPQITFPTIHGHFTAPAQALLDEFEEAKREIIDNPQLAILWVNRLQNYQPGLVNMCKDTIALAQKKVEEWLARYMFENEPDGSEKARRIGEWLGNAKEHKTHGRPITCELARTKGLKIVQLEQNQEFQEAVLSVFHATELTFGGTSCVKLIENHKGKGLFSVLRPQKQIP